MASAESKRLTDVAELLRRGATLLQEACPECGGIQLRYKDVVLCVNCDDISKAESIKVAEEQDYRVRLRLMAANKVLELTRQLDGETDLTRQEQIAGLLLKYIEILNKLSATS